MSRCYHVEVVAYGLDDAATEALFDRIADAAHELDEQLTVSGGIPKPGECDCIGTDEPAEQEQDALGKAWTEIRRLEELNNNLAEINNRLFFQMLDAYDSKAAAVAKDHLASLNDIEDSRPGPEQGGTQTSTKPAGTGQNQAPEVP